MMFNRYQEITLNSMVYVHNCFKRALERRTKINHSSLIFQDDRQQEKEQFS